MQAVKQPSQSSQKVKHLLQVDDQNVQNIAHIFSKLPCFRSELTWQIYTCVLEGWIFLPQLELSYASFLPSQHSAKND